MTEVTCTSHPPYPYNGECQAEGMTHEAALGLSSECTHIGLAGLHLGDLPPSLIGFYVGTGIASSELLKRCETLRAVVTSRKVVTCSRTSEPVAQPKASLQVRRRGALATVKSEGIHSGGVGGKSQVQCSAVVRGARRTGLAS